LQQQFASSESTVQAHQQRPMAQPQPQFASPVPPGALGGYASLVPTLFEWEHNYSVEARVSIAGSFVCTPIPLFASYALICTQSNWIEIPMSRRGGSHVFAIQVRLLIPN
jgi:hypothetical protein